eukprot:3651549-Amphidinium_carterae.1
MRCQRSAALQREKLAPEYSSRTNYYTHSEGFMPPHTLEWWGRHVQLGLAHGVSMMAQETCKE